MRKVTNDEKEIRAWAARYDARPIQREPFRPDGEPAQLGFVFGDLPPEALTSLQPIEWSRFFAIFHLLGLVLAYSDDREFEILKIEGGQSGRPQVKRMQA